LSKSSFQTENMVQGADRDSLWNSKKIPAMDSVDTDSGAISSFTDNHQPNLSTAPLEDPSTVPLAEDMSLSGQQQRQSESEETDPNVDDNSELSFPQEDIEGDEFSLQEWINTRWIELRDFLEEIISSKNKIGKDFYTQMFFSECVAFLFLLFFQEDFTGYPSGDVAQVFRMFSFRW